MEGTWVKDSSEGVEELLQALKAENFTEKAQNSLITTIIQEGSHFTIERKRPKVTVTNRFCIGERSEFSTMKEGFMPQCDSDLEGGVLTIRAVDKDYKHELMVDENGKLKEVFRIKGMVATRWSSKMT